MSNELVAATVQGIGSLVTTMVQGFRENRVLRKAQQDALRDKLHAAQIMAKANHLGDIYLTNLQQLIRTQRYIDEHQLSPRTLAYAMDQMEMLSNKLARIVDGYER